MLPSMVSSGARIVCLLVVVSVLLPCFAFASADMNNDGVVDDGDLQLFVQAWRRYRQGLPGWKDADLNGDGVLDYKDVNIFLDAFVRGYVVTVQLADYMPAGPGDLRLFQGTDGLIGLMETIQATEMGEYIVERRIVSMFNDLLEQTLWRIDNGCLAAIVGWFDDGVYYEINPSTGGAALPESLALNEPATVSFDVYRGGTQVGTGSLTLTLLARSADVSTPAGTFSNCIRVRIELTWSDGSQQHSSITEQWFALNVGEVRVDVGGTSAVTSSWVLAYAEVGAVYGSRPNVNVAQDLPGTGGSLYLWQGGSEIKGAYVLPVVDIGGHPVTRFAELYLPLGTRSTFWSVDANGYVRGFSGWQTLGEPEIFFSPVFTWPEVLPVGWIEVGGGNLDYSYQSAIGTYTASFAVVGTDISVDTPAGTFSGCHVYCLHIEGVRGGSTILNIRQRWWVKPGLGPVRIDDFTQVSTSQAGSSTVSLIFARVGTQTHGTQPTVDYADLLKLAAGNTRRLGQPNGAWRVVTVVGQSDLAGYNAWEILTAESGSENRLGEMSSDFWDVQASQVLFVAMRPDPSEFNADVLAVADPPPAIPRPVPMGDPVHFAFNFVDASSGEVLMAVEGDLLYAGRHEVVCAAGSFTGAHEIQICTVTGTPPENFGPPELEIQYFDDNAGLVGTVFVEDMTNVPKITTWRLEWAKVGSATWNYPGLFDIATYYPLATGNRWRYGEPGDYWHYEVGAQTAVGTYTNAYPVRFWPSDEPEEVEARYRVLQPDAMLMVGVTPAGSSDILPCSDPIPWPRPWDIGTLARTETELVDPEDPAMSTRLRELAVPVGAGVEVDTPAGHFSDCIRLACLRLLDKPPFGVDPMWEYVDMILAPNVGPVALWRRDDGDEVYWGPGDLFWATVGGNEYGNQ